jgi:hypothetical protein
MNNTITVLMYVQSCSSDYLGVVNKIIMDSLGVTGEFILDFILEQTGEDTVNGIF